MKTKPAKTVLLITHSGDYFTIDNVERRVAEFGYRPYRLDTDTFPQTAQLAIRLKDGTPTLSWRKDEKEQEISGGDIHSVWMRRFSTPHIDEDMDPILKQGCIRESRETLDIFLKELDHLPWLDHRGIITKTDNKFYQLKIARQVGLRVPQTLITNTPAEVRRFYDELDGNMITKMLTPLTTSMGGGSPFVYTHAVSRQALEELDSLCYSPMIFQERIPKAYELRVAYVDGELFTGAVETRKFVTAEAQADWRASGGENFQWIPYTVPETETNKIREMMNRFGLKFGAIDIIVTPGNDYVFLEVNPVGEWGMLEKDLELPISRAIARVLTREH